MTVTQVASFDPTVLADRLHVFDERRSRTSNILEAAVNDPVLTQTIDGASSLEVDIGDAGRTVLRDPNFGGKMWAVFGGVNGDLHFELVNIRKNQDLLTLKFEDSIVAALRRRDSKLSIKPGTMSRRQFAIKLAKEAKVDYDVDDTQRGLVQRLLERSVHGKTTNSWDVLGDAAQDVNWRRFSDGLQLVMGGDDWLLARDPDPTVLREFAGAVHNVDFDLDTRRRASQATVMVDVELWGLPPGSVCRGDDLGPADGKWLVSSYTRTVTSPRGTVELVRGRHALKEPKRRRNTSVGDHGDPDFPPGQGGTDTGGTTANGARAKMVAFALAQAGDAYVYGAHGPTPGTAQGWSRPPPRPPATPCRHRPRPRQWRSRPPGSR